MVISKHFCHCQSLQPQSNICSKARSLPLESSLAQVSSNLACKYQTRVEGIDTDKYSCLLRLLRVLQYRAIVSMLENLFFFVADATYKRGQLFLYYKHVTITMSDACTINMSQPQQVLSIMIIRDAPSCGITYNHHSNKSRGVIYNNTMFIVQATGHLSMVQTSFSAFPMLVPLDK